jgi:hypothetical protein
MLLVSHLDDLDVYRASALPAPASISLADTLVQSSSFFGAHRDVDRWMLSLLPQVVRNAIDGRCGGIFLLPSWLSADADSGIHSAIPPMRSGHLGLCGWA